MIVWCLGCETEPLEVDINQGIYGLGDDFEECPRCLWRDRMDSWYNTDLQRECIGILSGKTRERVNQIEADRLREIYLGPYMDAGMYDYFNTPPLKPYFYRVLSFLSEEDHIIRSEN